MATDLSAVEGWSDAIAAVRERYATDRSRAEVRALSMSEEYVGRRAAMVFDVVASRRRNYAKRVLPTVARFEMSSASSSLTALATTGPVGNFGLMPGEAETMRNVAAGMLEYCSTRSVDEEAGLRQWAVEVEPFVHAPQLDRYVGSVSGIGPALFAYMRMRCGADAIKPDGRVVAALQTLGFPVTEAHGALVVAHAAAMEVGISLVLLDQLLWTPA